MKSVAMTLLVLGGSTPLAAQAVKTKEGSPGLRAKASVSADSAIAIARRAAPAGATISDAELEEEDGHLMYSFDFKLTNRPGVQEVGVDARTGKILENSYESPEAEAAEAKADSAGKARPR